MNNYSILIRRSSGKKVKFIAQYASTQAATKAAFEIVGDAVCSLTILKIGG